MLKGDEDLFNGIDCYFMLDFVQLLLDTTITASGNLLTDANLKDNAKFIPFFPSDYCDAITAAKVNARPFAKRCSF